MGAALARLLPAGSLVALRGDLASGKTCFTRGMSSAHDEAAVVHSPTFTIINQYGGESGLFHVDLYRLSGPEEVLDLGFEELVEGEGVCVVEWAERAEGLLPPRRVDVGFEHAGGDARRLRFMDHGLLPDGWREALEQARSG